MGRKVEPPGPGGHWPRKGVWGCAALKTLFSRLSCSLQESISSKRVSSQDPFLRKFGNFSLYSLNFHPNFSSQAPKFRNFQLTSPQIWLIFSSQAPLSEANISSQAPHFGNPGRTPLLEKSWGPPGLLVYQWPEKVYFRSQILERPSIGKY